MSAKLFPPKVGAFVQDMSNSPTHCRMLHIGMVLTKVSAMFQILPDGDAPDEAKAVFYLLLEGLESGSAAEYAKLDSRAMAIYHAWLASREVH
ncbi:MULTISPECIES: hypothetical protein [unclassified Pseudoxanthomonas]|uniref:hypothetical protein n=1 Tax=unclassified Pseudoxanthomonas TaxID=2645906 RepID=UPI00307EFF7D